jgi:hypothetical protein
MVAAIEAGQELRTRLAVSAGNARTDGPFRETGTTGDERGVGFEFPDNW